MKFKIIYNFKKQIGGTSSSTSTIKGTGEEIIELFTELIRIYDNNGLSALENYLKENNLTLHKDSTNESSLEKNLKNIRFFTNLFYEKYKNDLDIGYRDFNNHAIGGYVCLDAKVEVLSSFLLEDNPFKSGKPKDQILGLKFIDVIKNICDIKVLSSEQYRRNKTKNIVFIYLKASFQKYMPYYITEGEIQSFLDENLNDYLLENTNILDCDGKYTNLLELESRRTYIKKKFDEVNLDTLKIGDILHAKWGSEYPISSVDQWSVNTSYNGYQSKNELKYTITHVSVLQE